jgi:predicted heme/steroid binding protein
LNINDFRYGFTSLNIEFTQSKPNEEINIPSGVTYIDFDGKVYGNASSTIMIRGGDNKGLYAVNQIEPSPFFITPSQLNTLKQILRIIGSSTDQASISSGNGNLQEIAISMYENIIG